MLRYRKTSNNNCIFSALSARNMSFVNLNEQIEKKTHEWNKFQYRKDHHQLLSNNRPNNWQKSCVLYFFSLSPCSYNIFNNVALIAFHHFTKNSIQRVTWKSTTKKIRNIYMYISRFSIKRIKWQNRKKWKHSFKTRAHGIYACETYLKRSVENAQIQMWINIKRLGLSTSCLADTYYVGPMCMNK